MTDFTSYADWTATAQEMTPAEAGERIRMDADIFEDAAAVLVYADDTFIERLADGRFFCLIERSDIIGTRAECEIYLYAGRTLFMEFTPEADQETLHDAARALMALRPDLPAMSLDEWAVEYADKLTDNQRLLARFISELFDM